MGSISRKTLSIVLRRCDPGLLKDGHTCMEEAELVDYWNRHSVSLTMLNTQIDFDDIDHPLKTQFKPAMTSAIDLSNPVD